MTLAGMGAVVLAAGMSTRMGKPKMLLPWGQKTVIGAVVDQLIQAGIADIVVVTGGSRHEVENILQGLPVRCVFNPEYRNGEMIHSLQLGLHSQSSSVTACFVVLGDQPFLNADTITLLVREYQLSGKDLIIPSYQMRRGHPWLAARPIWPEVEKLTPPHTLRDFLKGQAGKIHYLSVDDPSILLDLDTPEDYSRLRPPDP